MGEVVDANSTLVTQRPASVAPMSTPPSQFHSPLTGTSLLTPDQITPSKTPKSLTPKIRTPRSVSPTRGPLQFSKVEPQDDWLPITESRNGNAWFASFHCLCSGIGVQSLLLPIAFSVIGWEWGIITLTVVFVWQLYTIYLLVQLHENTETGMRYSRYHHVMTAAFGKTKANWLALFPLLYLSKGSCVALNIIGGSQLKIFFNTVCGESCTVKTLTPVEWYLVFASAAVALSLLPNLNSLAGVSFVGALAAVMYSTIMWAISVIKDRMPGTSYEPVRGPKEVDKFFQVLNALGTISFAFKGHNLILEIQGTMPSTVKRPSREPMWKGAWAAYAVIAACFFPVAIGGFWAYGQRIPTKGGLLAAFYGFRRKDTSQFFMGLVSLLIVVNALSSFQIYSMPVFDGTESFYAKWKKKPCPWWLRVIVRALYGYSVFFTAVAVPSLATLINLVGGIALPVTLAYPCFMWLKMKKPKKYGKMWCLNWVLGVLGMTLSVLLVADSGYELNKYGLKFNFFKPK